MTEQELRALVREAIAHQLGRTERGMPPGGPRHAAPAGHPSHAILPVQSGMDGAGPCLIEPSVMCTHCGYCKSYGH